MAVKRKAPVKGASSSSKKGSASSGSKKTGTGAGGTKKTGPARKTPKKTPARKQTGDLIGRLLQRASSPRQRGRARAAKKGLFSLSPKTLQTMYGLALGLVISGLAIWLLWPSSESKTNKGSAKLQVIVEESKPGDKAPVAGDKTPVSGAKAPVYEEKADSFNRHLALTDAIILQTLRANGLDGSAVRFSRVRNVVEGGVHFERAELALELGDRSPAGIEEKLLHNLGRLSFPVTLTSQGAEGEEARLMVWLDGHLTHTIRLHLVPPKAEEETAQRARAAIIIDDLGNHPKLDAQFAGLDLELTLAVLPASPAGQKVARLITQKGRELMLHLPMEPHGYPGVDPGQGALLSTMDQAELAATLERDLDSLPGAVGVNNHMGSLLTEDKGALVIIFRRLKEKGLFFIDSRTTAKSKVEEVAALIGIKSARRSVFLDNVPEPEAIQAQLQRFMAKAESKEGTIAIGHPYRATLEALEAMSGELRSRLELVPASRLVR